MRMDRYAKAAPVGPDTPRWAATTGLESLGPMWMDRSAKAAPVGPDLPRWAATPEPSPQRRHHPSWVGGVACGSETLSRR